MPSGRFLANIQWKMVVPTQVSFLPSPEGLYRIKLTAPNGNFIVIWLAEYQREHIANRENFVTEVEWGSLDGETVLQL